LGLVIKENLGGVGSTNEIDLACKEGIVNNCKSDPSNLQITTKTDKLGHHAIQLLLVVFDSLPAVNP
jgi:hypothetical protein